LLFIVLLICMVRAENLSDNITITRFIKVAASASCPGNTLTMNLTTSDGAPATGVEIRLVLYEPFQGFRGLEHTDQNGIATIELTKSGKYRISLFTRDYDYDPYTEFDYPSLCPPPPPKQMNISVEPDCGRDITLVTASYNGTPLQGVFVSGENWSSLTGS